MLCSAKEAEQRKNDLIVYLAHDLKTPLTSVIGYLTLLQVLLTHHAELCLTLAIRGFALYFVQLRIAKVKHSSA